MSDVRGKVALVTGSRRGLGRLITEHLLENGAEVVGFARAEASFIHERYRHFQVDVSDAEEVQDAFAQVRRDVGELHILVNNAAVLTSTHAMIMAPGAAEAMLRTNVFGVFMVSREAAKLMKKGKWGRIVSIGSMAANLKPVGDSIYAATKAALATFTQVLARELAPFRITCNTIVVTALETEMLSQIPRVELDAAISQLPLQRLARPDDLMNVLDFLISERSSYITAQTIGLGGVH